MPAGKVDLTQYSVTSLPPRQTYEQAQSAAGFKIPTLDRNARLLSQSIERLRQSRSSHVPAIESKLHSYSKNANINTTSNKPAPSLPEKNFRDYVDNQVDIMNRFSVQRLKKRIEA